MNSRPAGEYLFSCGIKVPLPTRQPAWHAKLAIGGLDVVGGPPEQFARFIAAEISKWTKIAKDVGAKVD